MLPRHTILALIVAAGLLTAGCGEVIKTYSDLRAVQNALTKKFNDEVTVTANNAEGGVVFVVWFINSSLNDQSNDQRLIRGAEAVKVVQGSYPHSQKVREFWVGFIRQQSRFGVFHKRQVVSMHGYDKFAQPLPIPGNAEPIEPSSPTQVTASYDSRNDMTDIAVGNIQLEGKPGGLGLTVIPFFKVQGRIGEEKSQPPKTVSLNFASYAEKPRFEQVVPISFVADGKEVLKMEGTFTGRDAQFCYLTIPYPKFRSMVSGKELLIKLGDKEYLLTPNQLKAMYEMTEYVRN